MRALVRVSLVAVVSVVALNTIVGNGDDTLRITDSATTAGTLSANVAPGASAPVGKASPASATASSTKAAATSDPQLVTVAGVVDGDTLRVWIGGQRIALRVIGIDTPERGDCAFQAATSRMQSLAQSRQVRIEADSTQGDKDRYDRILRHVFTADGRNIAQQLISEGLGHEYTYSKPYRYQAEYRAAQAGAQRAKVGLWATGACGAPSAAAPAPGTSCEIKGNISVSSGEKIYHMPGQQNYVKTRIDLSGGERWFCTEAEAVAAGWRKARR